MKKGSLFNSWFWNVKSLDSGEALGCSWHGGKVEGHAIVCAGDQTGHSALSSALTVADLGP